MHRYSPGLSQLLGKAVPQLAPGSCGTHRAQHALDLPVQLLHGPINAVHLVHNGQLLVLQNFHICQGHAPTRLGSIGLQGGVSCLHLQGQCTKPTWLPHLCPFQSATQHLLLEKRGLPAPARAKGQAVQAGLPLSPLSPPPPEWDDMDLMRGMDCLHLHRVKTLSQ